MMHSLPLHVRCMNLTISECVFLQGKLHWVFHSPARSTWTGSDYDPVRGVGSTSQLWLFSYYSTAVPWSDQPSTEATVTLQVVYVMCSALWAIRSCLTLVHLLSKSQTRMGFASLFSGLLVLHNIPRHLVLWNIGKASKLDSERFLSIPPSTLPHLYTL